MSEDATATYRGYRKQALYTLWRIVLDPDPGHIYRPEGQEDLAVYDGAQKLIEVIQVKDYSDPLSLSDFKPSSARGFFARMFARQTGGVSCTHTIATYGPLGPELEGAINGEERFQRAVVEKLAAANPQIKRDDAVNLLIALRGNVHRAEETAMRAEIIERLRSTIAGGDLDGSLALLLFWMFDAAENKRDVTRDLLEQQLERIGEHLAQLRDGSAEWLTTVVPVRDLVMEENEQAQLRAEYGRGVHASWRHIAAKADWPREQLLAQVHAKLERHPIVIIHGASGQGKSSLAWRYLCDYAPDGLRFHVRIVEDALHALRIAHVLQGHARSLRLPPVVYLDVAPTDTGWVELLRPLALERIRVLVTVREEDLARVSLSVVQEMVGDVALHTLSNEDAQHIYAATAGRLGRAPKLSFDDAWARFSAPQGAPLLEFTHLVSEGEELSNKVAAQIQRIQLEAGKGTGPVTSAHVVLLALCAIANEADCRIDVGRACEAAHLDPLVSPLALFENEYLIRLSGTPSRTTVAPLHALRSRAIVTSLLKERPEGWLDLATRVLPLLVDPDIELFLLNAFSRRQEHAEDLRIALDQFAMRSWSQAAGIVAALLWEGVSAYQRQHQASLTSTIEQFGTAWYFMSNLCFGGETAIDGLRDTFSKTFKREITRALLPSRDAFFIPLRHWFEKATPPSTPPRDSLNWRGAGDVAFWLGKTKASSALRAPLNDLITQPISSNLKVADLAAFVSGQHALEQPDFGPWHSSNATELKRVFIGQTESLHVEDDGSTVTAFFPVNVAQDNNLLRDVHAQTMRRLNLLRELFPQRDVFSSRGVGLEVFGELISSDPTIKNIPKENFPDRRLVQLNATTDALVNYRLRRVADWQEYLQLVLSFRRTVCDGFAQLHGYWETILAENTVRPKTARQFPTAVLDRIRHLSEVPILPREAVDEWGFTSESRTDPADAADVKIWNRLMRFKPWTTAFGTYASNIRVVAQRAMKATAAVIERKKGLAPSGTDADGHMLLINLEGAVTELITMQRAFQDSFRWQGLETGLLEKDETRLLRSLWFVAFAIINEPTRRRKDATRYLVSEFDAVRTEFLGVLEKRVSVALTARSIRIVTDVPVDGLPTLWVVCDHESLRDADAQREGVARAIWTSAQSRSWRPYEWIPLSLEWRQVVVVHLVQGKAIFSRGSRSSLRTLFQTTEAFEVGPLDLAELPIAEEALLRAGLTCWDAPLIRAVLAWYAALTSFTLVGERGRALLGVIEGYEVEEKWLRPLEDRIHSELTTTYDLLRQGHEDLYALLEALASSKVPASAKGETWKAVLSAWPADSSDDDTGITSLGRPDYVSEFVLNSAKLLSFATELLDWAIHSASR